MNPLPLKKAGSARAGSPKGSPQTPGPQAAGSKTPGSKAPGTKTSGTRTPGTKTAGTKTAGTKQPAPREAVAASSALDPRPTRWLLKTDPDSFPFDALWSAPRRTTGWDGVRNHQARNYLRDGMRAGDLVLIYHSSSDPVGVIGVGRIAGTARPDPTQFDPRDHHFDAKSRREAPTWWEVDVQALVRCPHFVTLAELRAEPRLAGLAVLQKGQRLSVQPVDLTDFEIVLELAGVRRADLRA